ncbi:MAG: hypothetical protein GY754_11595, partial [bacterium]|nr:hypothetical protein [bacterium]
RYDFYNLHIDQAMVRAFILPGGFSPGILPFIKWKHENNRQIKLFCDNKTHGNALSRIYPDCIVNNTFNKMEYNTGEEQIFSNSGRSSNLMVRYKKVAPCAKELSLVYINDYSGLEEYIALEADLFMMTSNVYSGALPLLKNIETPVVIISNGEKDAAVSASPLVPLLQPLVQYELKKYETEASFLQDLIAHIYDDRILDLLKDWSPSRISGLKKILPRPKEASLEELISIYNTKAMLSLELCTAANSSYAKKLLSVIGLITKKYDEAITAENFKFRFKVNLALLRNRVYKIYIPLVEEEDEPFPVEIFDEITEENLANCQTFKDESVFRTYSEIIADRERLRRLLALYYEKDPQRKKETKALQKSINERKELFAERDLSPDKSVIKAELRKIRLKKIKKGLLILFILIILFGVYYWGSIFYLQYKTREQEELARKKIEAEKHRIENLVKNYKIHVSEYDIYIYANKVARKNGFAPLELKYLRKKNPNWIYPGNILYLKDGEKIKVKKGNTLWGLSEKKLMKGHLRFYSLIDKIKESGINKELLQSNLLKAKKMAFSKKHFELLEKIKKNTLPGNCQPKINK